jgi:hypothetical protein
MARVPSTTGSGTNCNSCKQIQLGTVDRDVLAVQLTAALDAPLLLYLSASDLTEAALQIEERLAQGWQDLVQRVCRP